MTPVDAGDGHVEIEWQPVDHFSAAAREKIARARSAAAASYESYYGLAEPPFSLTPTVRFAFRSRSYATALDDVRRAFDRREGFIVITGEVGTGKSMLCRAAMQETGPQTFISLILDPQVTAEELLAQVLSDFGVLDRDARSPRRIVPPAPLHQLIVVLQRFLTSLVPLGGRAVVIIDEAQHLHPALLEQLRLWSNLDGDGPPLLQIVLSGQPELDELLGRAELRQVRQRVSRRCELTGLQANEVAEYIEHRLMIARGPDEGQRGPVGPAGVLSQGDFWKVRFSPSAIRTVAALTNGVPRLVNLLADRALEVGCERHARTIDARIVREAAKRLNLHVSALARVPMRFAAAAAVVVLLAGGAFGWKAAAEWSHPQPEMPPPQITKAPQPAAEIRTLDVHDSVSVTVASLRSEQRATAIAAQLVEGGFPAFTRRDPDGISYQVIVGPYVSPEEAAAAQRALQAQGVTGTTVRLENTVAGP